MLTRHGDYCSIAVQRCLIYAALALAVLPGRASAHAGSLAAPTAVTASLTIDGTIDAAASEAAWGTAVPADTLPNNCTEFMNVAPPFQVFAVNDGTALFLAFDIPDSTPAVTDRLFLFFDSNHSGGAAPGADDRALQLTFDNLAAANAVPNAVAFSGTGAIWGAGTPGLPAGAQVKYTRIAAGSGKWQLEASIPVSLLPGFGGATLGFAFVYLNKGMEDCPGAGGLGDGTVDDFYATHPASLTLTSMTLPDGITNPAAWGDLNFGPAPPTVSFVAPLCCSSSDIITNPSVQPFQPHQSVDISARVHNLHASSVAQNVNVEIRVHDFGTGGTVIAPFPLQTSIASIGPLADASSSPVTWPDAPPGLHGCIQAQIKPPTTSLYVIAGAAAVTQRNVDVEELEQGMRLQFRFNMFNPEPEQALQIALARQLTLPQGMEGLEFELEQPSRRLKPLEAQPVVLRAFASANTPIARLDRKTVTVPGTADGGENAVRIPVTPGAQIHVSASGEVDLDGAGDLKAIGPNGTDLARVFDERRMLLGGKAPARVAGALIGSFDGFRERNILVGANATFDVPSGVDTLWLAVNDAVGLHRDNTGAFLVHVSVLPGAGGEELRRLRPTAALAAVVLPQLDIAATSFARVQVRESSDSYNLLTHHGAVTYQFIVVEPPAGGGGGDTPAGHCAWLERGEVSVVLLIVSLLLLGTFLWRWRHRSERQK